MLQFRCCGVTNHTDWFEVYNASRVPDSCCLEYSDNCGLDNPGTWWTAVSCGMDSEREGLHTIPVCGGLATPFTFDVETKNKTFGLALPKHDYNPPHIFARWDKVAIHGQCLRASP